jgi:hypothetical protein
MPKLEARLALETMVVSDLTQTEIYRDGDASTVSPYYLSVGATYQVAPKIDAMASYTLSYESYDFTGPSSRDPANGLGSRTDVQHLVGAGVIYWF